MKLFKWVGLSGALLGALFALLACGREASTPLTPASAADGLNTFIYVYAEN
ncbi:MAG: hypothetical protein M3Q45_05045 [Chloroflexota bacterium]|nr:hypothetical protein [Chloroflexota bacterium]